MVLRSYGPSPQHYGGSLQFAPDGTLWPNLGDGGDDRAAADPATPRGGVTRLDVSTPGIAGSAAGNDHAEPSASPDLWASGLRNPWRGWLDPDSGLFFVGDVGEDDVEEINVVDAGHAGLDFGWPRLEGTRCFGPGTCDGSTSVAPVVEIDHEEACTAGYAASASSTDGCPTSTSGSPMSAG